LWVAPLSKKLSLLEEHGLWVLQILDGTHHERPLLAQSFRRATHRFSSRHLQLSSR
jgi:hypothetical protein